MGGAKLRTQYGHGKNKIKIIVKSLQTKRGEHTVLLKIYFNNLHYDV